MTNAPLLHAEQMVRDIAAASNAWADTLALDSRYQFLKRECEANGSEAYNPARDKSFGSMVAHGMSAANARRRRAGILLRARSAKLFNGCPISHRLSEAAEVRRHEINRRYLAASDRNLRGVDAALSNMRVGV